MSTQTPSMLAQQMERLSSKPGVIATLTMDRISSTPLSFNGKILSLMTGPAISAATIAPTNTTNGALSASVASTGSEPASDYDRIGAFARMVWEYVNSTVKLVEDMDAEDDLKLLRLRTKKHELVIVPNPKFIFVAAYDAKSI